LPAQYGFDVSEELVFTFDSLVSQRNFLFKIESSFDALNDSSIDLSHIKFTTLKKDKTMPEEYVLAQSKLDLTSQTNEFKLNSVFSSLRINNSNIKINKSAKAIEKEKQITKKNNKKNKGLTKIFNKA